ncbi:hypothetical protein LSH36_444g02052 [Paralvinella palmiformis]|uniref:Uncharacterized protein n=1 Tax=Paralvinella palmiformis TaxID=53620 RepID=A0AAD9MZ83_9ANNE|nr:hypothetical protein LSH36_444g02052 [Paralvinella palmiformis]
MLTNVAAGKSSNRRQSSLPGVQVSNSGQNGSSGSQVSSFFTVLASKRLAKQAAHKVYSRRSPSASSHFELELARRQPSYRMEPRRRLDIEHIKSTVEVIINRRMKGFHYSADVAGIVTKIITEEIKDAVKEMNFDRYKLVCMVSLGQRQGQGVRISSRCVWDPSTDNHCTYSWSNGKVFCTATVFGMYHE